GAHPCPRSHFLGIGQATRPAGAASIVRSLVRRCPALSGASGRIIAFPLPFPTTTVPHPHVLHQSPFSTTAQVDRSSLRSGSAMTISFMCFAPGTAALLQTLKYADEGGVEQAWLPTPPLAADPLIVIAHAAAQTSRLRFGVGVLPIHQRHPAVLAGEALALADLLPDRFSLGLGVSHAFIVEGMYGLPHDRPVARLREYVRVLRGLVDHGTVD